MNNTFGIKGVDQYCTYFKSIEDAGRLRARVSECFERAALPATPEEVGRRAQGGWKYWLKEGKPGGEAGLSGSGKREGVGMGLTRSRHAGEVAAWRRGRGVRGGCEEGTGRGASQKPCKGRAAAAGHALCTLLLAPSGGGVGRGNCGGV